ncbi:MAG: porin family protein [Flavobacteriales bacterium]
MKRLGPLLALLGAWAVPAMAQWEFAGGPTVGWSMSQIHGDGESGFNKLGLSAGFTLDVTPQSGRTVRSGLLFTQKGSRRVPNPKAGDYTTWRYRLTYLDVPVLRVVRRSSGVWFAGGVQASYLLRGEEDFYGNGYEPLTYLNLRPVDLCAVGAVGYDAESSRLEVRLSQSIVPIAPRPPSPVPRYDNFMMNLCIQVLGSWNFSASR